MFYSPTSNKTGPRRSVMSINYVVNSGVRVSRTQSGQAIKLLQITPYANDFQTLDNPGSGQPVGALKN